MVTTQGFKDRDGFSFCGGHVHCSISAAFFVGGLG